MNKKLQSMTLDELVAYRNTLDEEIKNRSNNLKKELFNELSMLIYKIQDKGFDVYVHDERLCVEDIEID